MPNSSEQSKQQVDPGRGLQGPGRIPLLLLAGAIAFAAASHWQSRFAPVNLSYSEFQQLLRDQQVGELMVGSERITGRLLEPRSGRDRFVTLRVEPKLAEELEEAGVSYQGLRERSLLAQLLAFVPILFLIALGWLSFRALRGGAGAGLMSVGRSRAKVYVQDDTRASFSDVAGIEEAKAELEEVVAFLRDPSSHGRLGARMPKGILLVGPPGTGKTLLARAVAGEAGVPFFHINGSEFVEMFVGVGAARVRDLFEQARAKAPCIIFVDELDALGRARGSAGGFGGHDEKEQTLNQLLVELDGFDPTSGIVLLAATNRPEVLDPALLRAGRFDRQVLVDRPDRSGRVAILEVHLRKVKLGDGVDASQIAALTPGFSGADIANLVNEAALMATRRRADRVEMRDFDAAVERIVAGLEKRNRLLNPHEREIVAHHELGHALVATVLPSTDRVHKISIIPRGVGALGYTMQRPTEDRFIMTRQELEDKLAVLLGGRAAELLVYGHLSTGASDDIARATELAREMVTRYALVPELGSAALDAGTAATPFGMPGAGAGGHGCAEATLREIDAATRALVDTALERARSILGENRSLLEEGARLLLEKEALDEAELGELFESIHPRAEAA